MMSDVTIDDLTVGVLGGTGAQGRGLALRWAASGLDVVLGSRDSERAEQAAAELNEELSSVDRRSDRPRCRQPRRRGGG